MSLYFRRSFALAVLLGISLPGTFVFGKRAAPAEISPVVSGDVRYEAPHFNNPCEQAGGCVVAYDNGTNALLWSVKVYCTLYDPGLEQDVQDVFITSLSVENEKVQISNEKGLHFAIDPATLKVTGDERGCAEGSSSGCIYLPARSIATSDGIIGILGIIGLVGILVRSRRRSR
jgi:outer membrane protein assembly factor BamB